MAVVKRVKSILLGLVLAVTGLLAGAVDGVAQDYRVPEEEDVLSRTLDPDSPYYLDRLLGKYFAWDEPLTDEELYYLYYGYAYSNHYRPLVPISAEDRVLAIVEKIMGEPTEESMHALVAAASEVMEHDPFSPKNLNFLAFAYGSLGDGENERKCFERMQGVLRTIESTGSGKRETEPMHVLMFSHAADVVYARGLDIKAREIVSRSCEYVFLTERDNEGNLGFYFDFSRVYMVPHEQPATEPQKRGWRINDMPLK